MKKLTGLLVLLIMAVALSACASPEPIATGQPGAEVKLTPYHTATATPTITPTPEGLPTTTHVPTMTPTPQVYEVQANDTMIGIANYFGLTLEELQAANPGVQPAFIYIGTKLTIPAPQAKTEAVSVMTPVPYAVNLTAPNCVRSLTGGYHCYALVENGEIVPLENFMAEITLIDPETGDEISQQTILPLTRLAPGTSLPFYVYFAPPIFENPEVSANILSVTEARLEDDAVFPLVIEIADVSISLDGASANVTGTSVLAEGAATSSVTLVAVAYDAPGRVVGLRRVSQEMGWGNDGKFDFEIAVYSTGGIIDRVEVWGEAGK